MSPRTEVTTGPGCLAVGSRRYRRHVRGVSRKCFHPLPALREKLDAQPALPGRLRDVKLVLAGGVSPEILEMVHSLTYAATRRLGFPRALATVQSWEAMGKPKDTTLTTSEHFEQVVPAKLEACCGFVLGKAFEHNDAARLGSADAPTAPLPASTSLTGGDVRRHRTTIYDCMP